METKKPAIFVVIEDDLMINDLCEYLSENFDQRFTIRTFKTMNETLKHLDKNPDIVILDNALKDEDIFNYQMLIQKSNAHVNFIILTTNHKVGLALNEFFDLPLTSLDNHKEVIKKSPSFVHRAAVYPINFLTREFKINKFVAIFILTFVTVGIISLLGFFLFVHEA